MRDAGESVLIGDLVVRHKVCTAVASPAAALPVPVETGRAQAHCLDLLADDGVLPGLLLLRLGATNLQLDLVETGKGIKLS